MWLCHLVLCGCAYMHALLIAHAHTCTHNCHPCSHTHTQHIHMLTHTLTYTIHTCCTMLTHTHTHTHTHTMHIHHAHTYTYIHLYMHTHAVHIHHAHTFAHTHTHIMLTHTWRAMAVDRRYEVTIYTFIRHIQMHTQIIILVHWLESIGIVYA